MALVSRQVPGTFRAFVFSSGNGKNDAVYHLVIQERQREKLPDTLYGLWLVPKKEMW